MMRWLGRKLLLLAMVLAVIAAIAAWAFHNVGRWLVDPDPLQHARAIVVLTGNVPFRAMQAAEIYRQGWAPQVWLLKDDVDDSDIAFAHMSISHPKQYFYDQQVLEHLGVPHNAIKVLDPPTTNTLNEMSRIIEELKRQGADKVIIVTSPLHTRRSKLIWHKTFGNHPEAIVRLASQEPTDPEHWWRATQDIQDVTHEVLGLIDAELGFVAKPR